MANYKLVNADQLDSDLTAVGNAIRSKSGTSAKLSFPSGMVSAIGAISTGVELNFDVVPGLTQPGTAAENTIWVKTEKIGAWYFSATQPEGMQEWDVWFHTGTSSTIEFNALKKNGIQVYPISAKQYINGAWVDKTGKSYQNGKWVTLWDGVSLYKKGDQCTYITGGWEENYQIGPQASPPVFNADHIYMKTTSTVSDICTKNPIDLNGISKIYIDIEGATFSSSSAESKLVLFISTGNNPSASSIVARVNFKTNHAELNVEAYNGLYYVSVSAGFYVECKITDITWKRG